LDTRGKKQQETMENCQEEIPNLWR